MKPSTKSNPTPLPANTAEPQPTRQWQFTAIGTSWWIGVYQSVSKANWLELQAKITQRIEAFELAYSRFRADSLVTKISQQAGIYQLPSDADTLLEWYRELYTVTAGQVTPLIGRALSDAGYDADYSLQTKAMTPAPDWDAVMQFAAPHLTTQKPVLLDFGAAGKGYLVDIIATIITAANVTQYCIDASGDLVVNGLEPLRIGLENPDDSNQVIGVARVQSGALCGSAGNRRQWGAFHHILDPQKLESPRHLRAVWAMADSALQADGLTTALYFAEPATLQKHFEFEYLLVYANGMIERSPGFTAEIFGEAEV